MSNNMNDNKMDVVTSSIENIDKKEKMEKEKDNEKGSSITATGSRIQVAGNDNYQAVIIRGQRNVAFVRFLRFFLILTSGFLKNFQDFLRWKSGFLMLFQKIPAFGILAGIFVFISTCEQFVRKDAIKVLK